MYRVLQYEVRSMKTWQQEIDVIIGKGSFLENIKLKSIKRNLSVKIGCKQREKGNLPVKIEFKSIKKKVVVLAIR